MVVGIRHLEGQYSSTTGYNLQVGALAVFAKGQTKAGSETWVLFSVPFNVLSSFRSAGAPPLGSGLFSRIAPYTSGFCLPVLHQPFTTKRDGRRYQRDPQKTVSLVPG